MAISAALTAEALAFQAGMAALVVPETYPKPAIRVIQPLTMRSMRHQYLSVIQRHVRIQKEVIQTQSVYLLAKQTHIGTHSRHAHARTHTQIT